MLLAKDLLNYYADPNVLNGQNYRWTSPSTGGTFNGNPLTMAGGIAALNYLKENQEEIYPYLHEQGNRIASEINDFCKSNNIPVQMMNAGSK